MPEQLEDRALPGGSLLGLLFGVPLAEPFLGSVWADANPLGSEDLPGVKARRREHLAALEGLQRDRLLADELFGEVRRLADIAGATRATADAYVDVARARLLGVADTLAASDAARLASHDFLADLWWTDELLTSLARARGLGGSQFLAELPVEGDDPDGMATMGYGGYGNMPPVANDDYYSTKHDTALYVPPYGVMSNDYDPNYDPLSASLVSGPSHAASFSFNSNGSFSYTPAYHYVGPDSFVYRVSDGQYTDDATVSLNVYNSAPVASGDYYSTKHDTTLDVSAPGVKGNDYDYDYDPLTAILVTAPSHASSFTLNSNGSFTYTPAYHYVGMDSFTYKVNDGVADSPPATVSINVYNHTPVAINDSFWTKHDTALEVSAPGVKGNDFDPNYDPLSASLVSGPSHASSFTFNSNGNGSFTYTPAYHYVGEDTFTYKVNDGIVDSSAATVTINVYNSAPVFDSYMEGLCLNEDNDLRAHQPIFLVGDELGQMHATDPNGDVVAYSMDSNSYFSANAVTGVITVANAADLDAQVLAGNTITVPVHATDGILTVNDQFCGKVTDWIPQRYIDLTTANGEHYNPTSGAELRAILRQMQTDGDTISVLMIKGHGWTGYIQTGSNPGDDLTADYGEIRIGGQDMTSTFRAVTGNGSQIKLRGCLTRTLADSMQDILNNGTEVYGAVRFVIGIPGTPWTLGRYQ